MSRDLFFFWDLSRIPTPLLPQSILPTGCMDKSGGNLALTITKHCVRWARARRCKTKNKNINSEKSTKHDVLYATCTREGSRNQNRIFLMKKQQFFCIHDICL